MAWSRHGFNNNQAAFFPRGNECHPEHQILPEEGPEEFGDGSEDEDEEAPRERDLGGGVIEDREDGEEWSDD